MKKVIGLVVAVLLLLSSCAPEQPPAPPQPIYGTTPTVSQKGATVNGTALTLYGENYVNVAEFCAAVGREFVVHPGIETHTAEITHEISPICFTTDAQCPTGTCNYYLTSSIYDGENWYHPLNEVIEFFHYNQLEDAERQHTYYTAYPKAESVAEGIRVPALMYHAVSNDCWGIKELFVSPEGMEEQLQYLTENGYTPITFDEIDRLDSTEKPVMLTFDDGYEDNYTELFPLLKKYNVKVTIFLIGEFTGREHYLTAEQIREMSESGLVSFQSHTMTHPNLNTCDSAQLDYELKQSKVAIARLTGKEPFVVAYPSGKYNTASLEVTGQQYQFGLLSRGGAYTTGTDRVRIPRYYVSRYTGLSSFKSMIK